MNNRLISSLFCSRWDTVFVLHIFLSRRGTTIYNKRLL